MQNQEEIAKIKLLTLSKMLQSIPSQIFLKVPEKMFILVEDFQLNNSFHFRKFIKIRLIKRLLNKLILLKRVGGCRQDIKNFQDFVFMQLMPNQLIFWIKINKYACKIFLLINMRIKYFLIWIITILLCNLNILMKKNSCNKKLSLY